MSLFGGFGLIFRDHVGLEGVVYCFFIMEIPTDSVGFAHNFVLRLLGYSQFFFLTNEEPSAFAGAHGPH